MSCQHESLHIGVVKVTADGGIAELEIGEVSCKQCCAAMVPVEGAFSPTLTGFRVQLAPRFALDPTRLRCPRCGRRLFGRAATLNARLDRGVVVDVVCAQPHLVRYEDGVTVAVYDGTTEVA